MSRKRGFIYQLRMLAVVWLIERAVDLAPKNDEGLIIAAHVRSLMRELIEREAA